MTQVLVMGGSGMLGSMVVDVFARDPELQVTATVRGEQVRQGMQARYPSVRWVPFDGSVDPVTDDLVRGQQWVVNAIGITKPLIRDDRADEIERAIEINARLPHHLGRAAASAGARVLQIATDCVYSGRKGAYVETDVHDALDVYGKSKSLGETFQDNVHHLRCSIIGPEPKDFKFLIEWFRRQPQGAAVNGFTNHQWNGVTTLHFAKLCQGAMRANVPLGHLLHVVPTATISKAEMLRAFAAAYARPDVVISDVAAGTIVDRTLGTLETERNAALWAAAGYRTPPTVPQMIDELAGHDYRAV